MHTKPNGGHFQGGKEWEAGREVWERITLHHILWPVFFVFLWKMFFSIKSPFALCRTQNERPSPKKGPPPIPGWLNNLQVAWVTCQIRFPSRALGIRSQVERCRCLGWDAIGMYRN